MSFQSFSESLNVRSYFDNISYSQWDSTVITYKTIHKDRITMDTLNIIVSTFVDRPWIGSVIGSLLVGLSGIFPLLIIHVDEGDNLKKGGGMYLVYFDVLVCSLYYDIVVFMQFLDGSPILDLLFRPSG